MRIDLLQPYSKNAKKHPKKQIEQIANSIKEFGFNQPIVVDKDNIVIVGHGRLEAAKLLGITDVPTVSVDLTNEQSSAYRLADNKLNESDWNMQLAIEELKGLSDSMFDLTGFDRDLLIEPDEQDDILPESVPSRSKLGDLYELGQHRVLCGDSTNKEAIDRLMADRKADMVFTDPPYNVAYTGMVNSKQWDGLENDSMTSSAFQEFLERALENIYKSTKGEAALYLCHADKTHKEFRTAFEKAQFDWRVAIIWVKNSPAFNFAQYKYAHEPIFYCFKKGKTVSWYGDLTRKTVWHEEWDTLKIVNWYKQQIKLDKEQAKTTIWEAKKEHGDHPTIKPVELITKAIRNSSKQDDLILDSFLGSGSTLIAAEKTGRICYGMELDPKYVDVIVQRYVDYVDSPVVKINGQISKVW